MGAGSIRRSNFNAGDSGSPRRLPTHIWRTVVAAVVVVSGLAVPGAAASVRAAGTLRGPASSPPVISVVKRGPRDDGGYVFVAPKLLEPTGTTQGPEIVDDRGRAVWYDDLPPDQQAWNFQVQRYQGKPVLTWWQGGSHSGVGYGQGVDEIVDSSYEVIATVKAGDGYQADGHEFTLTPQGTALIDIYHQVPYDLSSIGGPTNGQVLDCIVQEIDVATGRVLFSWHSLDHIGLDQSYQAPPAVDAAGNATPYDYFHLNSVQLDNDGNLLLSARHTSTIYKIDRHTGDIIWQLGGKNSDFKMGKGTSFSWQHNAMAAGKDTVRIFNNASNGTSTDGQSRVLWIHLDSKKHKATLVKADAHPDKLSAGSQGNAEALPRRHTFVGWGQLGRVSEFDRNGHLLFDATLPSGYDTYRGFRSHWTGTPNGQPTASVTTRGDRLAIHAIWNGATEVRRWRVLAGPSPTDLKRSTTVAWDGLDTRIVVNLRARYVALQALDRLGHVIGTSSVVSARG